MNNEHNSHSFGLLLVVKIELKHEWAYKEIFFAQNENEADIVGMLGYITADSRI